MNGLFNRLCRSALLLMLWVMKHNEPWCCARPEYTLTRFDDEFLLILKYTTYSGEQQTVEAIGNALDISRAIQRTEARLVLESDES